MISEERTIGGLHDFLLTHILPRYTTGGAAVDLGAGSGALAVRLQRLGYQAIAVDIDPSGFKADVPFLRLDLNEPEFAKHLGEESFDLVTSVEVIEHLENPVGFLRNVRRLLKPEGVAIVTTPNVENLPARVKFLLTGKLRMMDEKGDKTHIMPIFSDLLFRQYLPRAGLKLVERCSYPPNGFKVTRSVFAMFFSAIAKLGRNPVLLGDNHIFVLRRQD